MKSTKPEFVLKDNVIKHFLELYESIFPTANGAIDEFAVQYVPQMIRNMNPAQVRPIVDCQNCKHKGWVQEPCHGKSVDYCHLLETVISDGFYCGAHESKE